MKLNQKLTLILFLISFSVINIASAEDVEKIEEIETQKKQLSAYEQWQMLMLKFGIYSPALSSIYSNNQGAGHIKDAFESFKERMAQEAQAKAASKQPAPQAEGEKNESGFSNEELEKLMLAYIAFVDAVGDDPYSAAFHLNLGVTNELKKEEDNAFKEYQTTLKLSRKHSEMAFLAYFNMGRIKVQMSQLEPALNYYRKALEIKPDSVEVRNNIELLWQSQQGKGKGKGDKDPEDKDKDKDGEGEGGDDNKEPKNRNKNQKYEYSGKNISKDQIKKILEEIKDQEQKIRAKQNKKSKKEHGPEKDW